MYKRNLKHSRVKNLYKFVSAKMNRIFIVEGSLEFDTCFHLDERDLPYTPDFQIVKNDTAKWIEVKPFAKTLNPDFLQRFKAKQEKTQKLGTPLISIVKALLAFIWVLKSPVITR